MKLVFAINYLILFFITSRRYFGRMFLWVLGIALAIYVFALFADYRLPRFTIYSFDGLAVASGIIGLLLWIDRLDPYLDIDNRAYNSFRRLTRRMRHKRQRRQPFYIAPRFEYHQTGGQGYIYFMRRKRDGVYKIGRTGNIPHRLPYLFAVYGELEPIAYWRVADVSASERQALVMTKDYFHQERGHKELRAMSERQAYRFVSDFTNILRGMEL